MFWLHRFCSFEWTQKAITEISLVKDVLSRVWWRQINMWLFIRCDHFSLSQLWPWRYRILGCDALWSSRV